MARGLPSTFSICAVDAETGEIGVAVQSKYFAVGARRARGRERASARSRRRRPGSPVYGPHASSMLLAGGTVARRGDPDVLARRRAARDAPARRRLPQTGAPRPGPGSACNEWAGHESGIGAARRRATSSPGRMWSPKWSRAFRVAAGTLAERLVAALEAGQAAGGDVRGQQSAAIVRRATRCGRGDRRARRPRHRPARGRPRAADRGAAPAARDPPALGLSDARLRQPRSAGRIEEGVAILARGWRAPAATRRSSTTSPAYESLAGRLDEALAHVRRGARAGRVAAAAGRGRLRPRRSARARRATVLEPV